MSLLTADLFYELFTVAFILMEMVLDVDEKYQFSFGDGYLVDGEKFLFYENNHAADEEEGSL